MYCHYIKSWIPLISLRNFKYCLWHWGASESKRLGTAALDWPPHYPLIPLLPAGVCEQRTSCHCTQSCSSWGNRAGGRHHCVWSSVWNYSTSESHNTNRHTYPPGRQKMYRETEKERKRHMECRMRLINK